jgi:hypothetical protein
MWIGTSTGVELLNDGNVDKSVDISCGPVFCMSQFDEDNLLILSGNSLCLLDKKSFEMTPVWQDDSSVRSRFTVTKDSVVWIYDSHNPVIHILDSQFTLIDMITLSGKGVNDVFADADGTVLVATETGLRMFDSFGHPVPFNGELKKLTEKEKILFVTANESGCRCIGVEGKGVYVFGEDGVDLHRVWEEETLEDIRQVSAVFKGDNIFLSKEQDGIDCHHLTSDKSVIPVSSDKEETLNMFYAFGQDSVLVLTNSNVYLKNLKENTYEKIAVDGHSSRDWMSISLLDKDGCLWVLNTGNELLKFSLQGKRLKLLS